MEASCSDFDVHAPLVAVQRALVRTVEMKDYHPGLSLMTVPSVSSGITHTPLTLMLSIMWVVGVNAVPVDAPEEGAGVAEEGVGAAEAGQDWTWAWPGNRRATQSVDDNSRYSKMLQ